MSNGSWVLLVGVSPKLIQFLRDSFALSMDQLRTAKRLAPGPLFRGTQIEMELLAELFVAVGVDAHAEPATGDVDPLIDVQATVTP